MVTKNQYVEGMKKINIDKAFLVEDDIPNQTWIRFTGSNDIWWLQGNYIICIEDLNIKNPPTADSIIFMYNTTEISEIPDAIAEMSLEALSELYTSYLLPLLLGIGGALVLFMILRK